MAIAMGRLLILSGAICTFASTTRFCIYIYRIHTESRVFTRYKKPRQKKRGAGEVFYKSRKHEGEVCILFKSIQ